MSSGTADDLLLKIKRVRAAARTKRDNLRDQQAQGQVATAVASLDTHLSNFEAALRLRDRLNEEGITVLPVGGLQIPAIKLRDHLRDVGRPTQQFLSRRSGDLQALTDELSKANASSWTGWATDQLDGLRIDEVPAFGQTAKSINERLVSLRRWASATPDSSILTQFTSMLQFVREDIASIIEGADPADLWTRITSQSVTLADLTDSELAELRHDVTIAGRIELSLRA